MDRRTRSVIVLGAAWCLLSYNLAVAGDGKSPRPIGAGAFPVSPMHAAAWFAHRADREAKSLTLMVYFEGAPGWHDKSTDFKWEVNSSPATIDMSVGSTPIHVRYWADTLAVQVMGHDFNLAAHNVFLVSNTDGPAPTVKGLGTHDLAFASEDNPALALLKRDAGVLGALLGAPTDEGFVSQATQESPPDLVAIDLQGLELIEKNTAEDDERACKLFRKAAVRGYAPSQYRLGICYGTGRGVREDLAAANQWYLRAAQQGYKDAQYKLAHSYRVGRGVPVDLTLALQWYVRAAENGDAEAQYNLGMMYSTGQGSEINLAKAFGWHLKAAENGEPAAQYEVARRYRDGEGVLQDLTSSYAWLIVLRTHRKSLDLESWRRVEDLFASLETNIGEEAKAAAGKTAEGLLRSYTRHYLRNLRK